TGTHLTDRTSPRPCPPPTPSPMLCPCGLPHRPSPQESQTGGTMTRFRGFSTRSVHAGEALDPTTGAFGVPIYQNTTYGFRSYDQLDDWRSGGVPHFYYMRDGNPTTRCLEVKLADLEGAEAAGAGASGMAVISATLLHLVPAGGQLVASADHSRVTPDFLR